MKKSHYKKLVCKLFAFLYLSLVLTEDFVDSQNGCIAKDFKDHLVPPPCHGQGLFPPDQMFKVPSNLALNTYMGGAFPHGSGAA